MRTAAVEMHAVKMELARQRKVVVQHYAAMPSLGNLP